MSDFNNIIQKTKEVIHDNEYGEITSLKLRDLTLNIIDDINQKKLDNVYADVIPANASSINKLATMEDIKEVNLFVELSSLTDQQRNKALANVSNQTVNSTTGKMGYKVLKPQDAEDASTAFNLQVTEANTIYEIRSVYDLKGATVTIPENVVLKNNGGLLKNCTIELASTGTSIESNTPIFGENVVVTGNPIQEASPEWFTGSDADKIQRAIECFSSIRLSPRTYNIDRPIMISQSFAIHGSGYGEFFGDKYPSNSVNGKKSILKAVGNIDCIIWVVGRNAPDIPSGYTPKKNYVSAKINGVCFLAARRSDGIRWSTPGGPSRPIEISNCNFNSLRYAFFAYGSTKNISTNVSNIYIIQSVITGCHWGLVASGNHAMGNITLQTCLIEGNHTDQRGTDEYSVYTLVNEKPEDWEFTYTNYYTYDGTNYIPVPQSDTPPTFEENTYYIGGPHYIDGGAIWAYKENEEYVDEYKSIFMGNIVIKQCNLEGNPKCIDIIGSSINVVMDGNYFEYKYGQKVIVTGNNGLDNCYMYINNFCVTHANKVKYILNGLTVEFGESIGKVNSNKYEFKNCYVKNKVNGKITLSNLTCVDYDEESIVVADESNIVARLNGGNSSLNNFDRKINRIVDDYPSFYNLQTEMTWRKSNVAFDANRKYRAVFYALVDSSDRYISPGKEDNVETLLFDDKKHLLFVPIGDGKLKLYNIDVMPNPDYSGNYKSIRVSGREKFLLSKILIVDVTEIGNTFVGYDLSKEIGFKDNITNVYDGYQWPVPVDDRIIRYSNGRWVDNEGFTFASKRGTTVERPDAALIVDDELNNGYEYYDTNLNKLVFFKQFLSNYRVKKQCNSTQDSEQTYFVSNPYDNATLGVVKVTKIRDTDDVHVYLTKQSDALGDDYIEIPLHYVGNDNGEWFSNIITFPSSSSNYSYFCVKYTKTMAGVTFLLSLDVLTSWKDAEGYTAALLSGDTASRPTNLTVDDVGFDYYDTDLGKKIMWNGTGWVNLDGTSLN